MPARAVQPPDRVPSRSQSRWLLLPREHGAWGMLLVPFLCAAILGRRWDWLYLPVLLLALTAFVMREPLTILARQKWIWRERKPESDIAVRCLVWQLPLSAALLFICLSSLPPIPLLSLAAIGLAVTGIALWMTVSNRQRSLALQSVSSMGLGTTALLAALVAERSLPAWSWWLWGLLSLHSLASILVVRARLELRSSSQSRNGSVYRTAGIFQIAQWILLAALIISGMKAVAMPVGFSGLVNSFELLRLRSADRLREPLRRVGFRALGASLLHAAITLIVLWPEA